jgi:glycosyltransferase involved in cell wall biosynthesis
MITWVTKTFERPAAVANLVASIRRFSTDPIVVVDDSREPYPELQLIAGLTYIRLPFDSGVSVGRNRGIAAVSTEFVFYCDDDHEVTEHTNVLRLKSLLQTTGLDLIAVKANDNSEPATFEVRPDGLHLMSVMKGHIGEVQIWEVVPNRFLARTASLKACKWPEETKIGGDHWPYFYDHRDSLKVGFMPTLSMLHHRTRFNTVGYNAYRTRDPHYQTKWNAERGFKNTFNLGGHPF